MAIFWFSSWKKKFELKEKGHKPSWAKLQIIQLELGIEPAQLGYITNNHSLLTWYSSEIYHKYTFNHWNVFNYFNIEKCF